MKPGVGPADAPGPWVDEMLSTMLMIENHADDAQ